MCSRGSNTEKAKAVSSRERGVRGCPCVLPTACAGAAHAPGSASGAPVLGSPHLAVRGDVSWRLIVSLEAGLVSARPKLNSSSAPLMVFSVCLAGLSCLGRDEGFPGITKDCPLSVS